MSDPAILIVGAGPSGLTAAIELKRRGLSPRIIDQKAKTVIESRALGINPRTLRILEPAGLSERLIVAGKRIQSLYLRSPNKLLLRINFAQLPEPHNFMLILPQDETEQLMAARLAEMGIAVEWSTSLTGLQQDGDQIAVELKGADGATTRLTPDIVIGADGAHSTVRHAIGRSFEGSAYEHRFGLADVRVDTDLPLDGINIFDRSPILFGMFPIRDNRVRLICDHEDIFNHVPPEIRIEEVLWDSPFRISHRLVDRYQSGNVFLVGDAAHIHSPFGGRGMNLGIEDAAWLAWLISEGNTDGFTEARRPVAHHVIETVDPATRFMASDQAVNKFVRRHVLPVLASMQFVQKRALPTATASNTPFPPWLEA